MKLYDPILLRT